VLERLRASRTTILVLCGIAATAAWLIFTLFEPSRTPHLSTGQVCFVHVGPTDRPMPGICVNVEARAPPASDTIIVILSRSNMLSFLEMLDKLPSATRAERSAFGTYEIHDSIRPAVALKPLAKKQMVSVLNQLLNLATAEDSVSAREALKHALGRLAAPG
jgi:hypothetical protein